MASTPKARFAALQTAAAAKSGTHTITGIAESRASLVTAVLLEKRTGPSLVLTPSPGRAARLGEDFAFFGSKRVYVYPETESRFFHFDAKSHQILEERLQALTAIVRGEDCVVLASAAAALQFLPARERFTAHRLSLQVADDCDLEQIKADLVSLGYERVPGVVEAKGQFSFRGDILDVFPPAEQDPLRIEFFDTQIDSIRTFDTDTQRSLENREACEIDPAQLTLLTEEERAGAVIPSASGEEQSAETLNSQMLEYYLPMLTRETAFLWDYLPSDAPLILEDPSRIEELLTFAEKEYQEDLKARLEKGTASPEELACHAGPEAFRAVYEKGLLYLLLPFARPVAGVDRMESLLSLTSRQSTAYNGKLDLLATDLKRYVKQGYAVTLACATAERETNLLEYLDGQGLAGKVHTQIGDLSAGCVFPDEKFAVISDRDVFTNLKYSRPRKESKHSKPIKAFSDIRKGDYVVHETHGIGKFLGVEPLDVQGVRRDYLKIAYAGEDYLYVPVEQMGLVQKYIGGGEEAPRISKLGGTEWVKTKARAKAAIEDMTKELLELSAARQMEPGYAFSPDTVWQGDFEDRFPYQETPDQLRAVREIKKDMERPLAMDRLLCGDVGYGKTEVAARAVFKCVAEGKQAAILVPTTVLASQHYETFSKRMDGFPFKVDLLCRFRTDKEQEKTIADVKAGKVDVLIGTHRMLSKDVRFKDLGLLVIDEEQRFGVQHKEAIKQLRKNVDVLTLSATPIPRTLHMSLVGIRDMSLIEEPPEERYPVQTYVMEQETEVVREAISRELDRGGQVYVVYNRVRGIQKIASSIAEMLPEAKVAAAHGQMPEQELEDVMFDFINGKSNVLVATSIIESGLDIPNVNTIIVLDADRFGLSQLYQLRGRVGRSNRMAYAYLMYQRDKTLSEVAEKRLRAIREFTEFGSGFRIAMRDLEIRGAGNLLGAEQSGHMMTIGYELYCKLVDDAVKRLSGQTDGTDGSDTAEEPPETAIELDVPAYIPGYYMEDELLRIAAYKKIADVESEEDRSDLLDELTDRFGDPPQEVLNLLNVARLKALAEEVGCRQVHKDRTHLLFEFRVKSGVTPEKIAALMDTYGMRLKIRGGLAPSLGVALEHGMDLTETARSVLQTIKG